MVGPGSPGGARLDLRASLELLSAGAEFFRASEAIRA